MEPANFGSLLREGRERRQISLAAVAQKTKVSPLSLRLLETGKLDDLPADIFVRGFIRSYARAVGMSDAEPIGMFEQAVAARRRAELIATSSPIMHKRDAAGGFAGSEDEGTGSRRGIGLAVFVIIVLLIATITLSLFLRQPPQSGERLSRGEPAAGSLSDQSDSG